MLVGGNESLQIIIFRKRIPLIILLLTILFISILVLSPVKTVYCSPYTDIDAYTANDMITNGTFPNLIVLDVRPTSFYDDGHIENATSIPSAELDSRIDELLPYNDTEIIVHCQLGGTSPAAAATLESHNFTKVFNLTGGFNAWESAGFPVIPESFSIMLITTLILSTAFVAIVTHRRNSAAK